MLTPIDKVLLLCDVWLQRLQAVEATAQDEIELKIAQRDAADLMLPFPCSIEIRRSNGIRETAFVRVGVEKKNTHMVFVVI